jgi:DNA polymerase-1
MLNVHRRLKREKLRTTMLMQIHDELVFESPPEEVEAASALIRSEMAGALGERVKVPLRVDLGVGPNWLETK